MMTCETPAQRSNPYGRHRVIGPGTDGTYFTSDDTHDEMAAGAINNSIRYTGQRFDAESGLMYYKYRYYYPAGGRFIGRDPLGWDETPNRYGYVWGMPTRGVDPLGLEACEECNGNANSNPMDGYDSWTNAHDFHIERNNSMGAAKPDWLGEEEEALWDASTNYELYGLARCVRMAKQVERREIANTLILYPYAHDADRNGKANGPADALRHCVWQCCLADLISLEYAESWGDAHEAAWPSGDPEENDMDVHNNEVGRGLVRNCDVKYYECTDRCTKAYNRGGLTVLPFHKWRSN